MCWGFLLQMSERGFWEIGLISRIRSIEEIDKELQGNTLIKIFKINSVYERV
jgi:hypothetical protein